MQSRCKKNDRRKVGRPPSFPITSQALEAANNYVAKYPSFTVLMKRYHWENGIVVGSSIYTLTDTLNGLKGFLVLNIE